MNDPYHDLIIKMNALADDWNADADSLNHRSFMEASALRRCADDMLGLIHCPSCGDEVSQSNPRCHKCCRTFHSGSCGFAYDDGNYCCVCRAKQSTS